MAQTMTHPDSGLEVQADADQVSLYLSQGWQIKPTKKASDDAKVK